ncbi:hypothetical protein [Arhodomonas sp. SL1]|uniref:hypothetical protein n=1 Tax=Arhodomonas sp. SL1 TaxID=3425691 RepID=UPI003F882D5C
MTERTYLTPEQVAARLHFSPRYFRNVVMKRDLIEGFHYTRAFHGRKYLLIWERVEQELLSEVAEGEAESGGLQIPMAKGGRCNV